MKRWIVTVLVLAALVVVTGPTDAIEFDMSNGAITAHYIQHNPVGVQVKDGKDGSIKANFNTEYYEVSSDLESEGEFETTMISLADFFHQSSRGKVKGEPETNISATFNQIREGEPEDKMVEVKIETTKSENGILKINYNPEELEIAGRSKAQIISDKLGVGRSSARELIGNYGTVRVLDAIDALEGHNPNNQMPAAAGGAGGIAGPDGVVSVKNLSTNALFNLYIQGIKYQGHVRYNSVFLNLYHPSNGNELNHLPAKVTLEGPVIKESGKDESSNVVLLGSMEYKKGTGYNYPFADGDWLVPPENLPSGPYKLHIDVDRVKHLTLPVKLTEDNTIVPR